jgi:hypothetical protein
VTVLTPPGYVQGGTYTAKLDRMYINTAAAFPDLTQALSARQGFFGGRVPVFANPSAMNVTVTACAGTIQNTFASASGDYRFVNDATVQVTLAAASPTQNRIDVVGFQVKDNIFDSSGLNTVVPAVIQGANSAGTPVAPALPPSFIPVVQYTVNAAVVSPSSPVSLIVRTTNDGGLLGVASATERALIGAADGMQIYRTDKDWVEIYEGGAGAWRVQSVPITSNLADITAPVTNQLALLSTDGMVYRYTGSLWRGVMHTVDGAGQARYQAGTTQNVPNTTDTKINFPVAQYTSADFSIAGNNTITCNRAGLIRVSASLRFGSSAGSGEVFMFLGDGALSTTRYAIDSKFSTNPISMAIADELRVAAGATLSLYVWQSGGGARTTDITDAGGSNHLAVSWLRN